MSSHPARTQDGAAPGHLAQHWKHGLMFSTLSPFAAPLVLAHSTTNAGSLWLAWNLSPSLVLGFAGLIALYWYAARPYRRQLGIANAPLRRGQVLSFAIGMTVLILALMSPLDEIGDEYLFSAHMVQHMLISVVAPPLILLGTPGWMLAPLLRRPSVAAVGRFLVYPAIAFGLFNADLWLWHAPPLYDATLQNETIHIFEHLTFIALGFLFWLPILSPLPEKLPRLARPIGMLYLFGACQPMVALGALLTFASQPFYEPYVLADRLWGFTPLGDQQLGGLIMWLPSTIPYLTFLSVLFFQWVGAMDHAERVAAGELEDIEAFGPSQASQEPQQALAEAASEGQ